LKASDGAEKKRSSEAAHSTLAVVVPLRRRPDISTAAGGFVTRVSCRTSTGGPVGLSSLFIFFQRRRKIFDQQIRHRQQDFL
jgi:hypothetical protein